MAVIPKERKSLLSSQARVQAPWIKVTIGNYTFGVFSKTTRIQKDANDQFYTSYNVQYPNYIKSLNIVKINGQINQYTLRIDYPVTQFDDPNFFEKIFSSVSKTRKIMFSYGDSFMPNYVYKDEEAIITRVQQSFNLASSVIQYTVSAVSSAALGKQGTFTFINSGLKKPSDEIKNLFKNTQFGLQDLFTGMSLKNIDSLIDGGDKAVQLASKTNIAPLDYINYLVSCMIPEGSTAESLSKDIWVLTIHDDTIYDAAYNDSLSLGGPYFKVTRTSYTQNYTDAYEIDIGYNTSNIVSSFSVDNNENYSIYYDYTKELYPKEYVRRINDSGEWEDIFSPAFTSKNEQRETYSDDITWFTKLTKYPISATVTVQGLLRPATLMQYVRLNILFPGGHKHIYSGLYIVTQQVDNIDDNGYKTTLKLTKISGDEKGDYNAN